MSQFVGKRDDWFLPAIGSDGSVSDALGEVLHTLSRKSKFIRCIQQSLCDPLCPQIDQLTKLGKEAKLLENTLRFRLGILHPDRHGAWFRQAQPYDLGPFRSPVHVIPVFSQYDIEKVSEVRESLKQAWLQHQQRSSLPNDECLWSVLLKLNAQLERVNRLSKPYESLSLDSLPDSLPIDLDTPSLRAFLLNVRNEYQSVKDRLAVCYEQLWHASEKLWEDQKKLLQLRQKREQSYRERERCRQNARGSHTYSESQSGKAGLGRGYQEMEALRFLGFNHHPGVEALRRRYIELAKKLHPDHGGSEDQFKLLSTAYRRLARRVR